MTNENEFAGRRRDSEIDNSTNQTVVDYLGDSNSVAERFAGSALNSFKYTAVQEPLKGIAQLSDHVAGTQLLPKVHFMDEPEQATYGSAEWYGQVAGGTLGSAAPFILMYKLAGPGAASRLELTSSYGLGKSALPYIGKSAATGFGYGAVLQPVAEGENFWRDRTRNAVASGLTFSTLTATTIGIKSSGIAALNNDVVSGMLSGVPSGIVNADANSLLSHGRLASGDERLQSIATYSLAGGLLGAGNIVHEKIKPTSGIAGVRTLSDMIKLADTTIVPGHPGRYAVEPNRFGTTTNTILTGNERHNRIYNKAQSDLLFSPVDASLKETIARGQKDMIVSMEALHNVGPVVTIYGSARLGPETFEYHRARYTAGLLAKEGYAVMSGGGPGIMEAANRGAWEANGTSVGVNLRLPHEQHNNGYQTISLQHADFYTRKEVLGRSNGIISEKGGFGTQDEVLGQLTQIQTGKVPKVPVTLVGSDYHGRLDNFFRKSLLADGTISGKDLNLYKIINDPREIVAYMRRPNVSPAKLPAAQPGTVMQQLTLKRAS